jgi:tetratricopeptide (TPR) repeat protein
MFYINFQNARKRFFVPKFFYFFLTYHFPPPSQAKYSEALEEAPMTAPLQRAVYFANRAACQMRLEEHSEAAIDCSAAIELHPEYTKALLRRASAFEAMADYEAALMDLKKVVELEPNNTAAIMAQKRIEPLAEKKREEVKDEMIGKLKDLGNSLLGKFGMSLDNFKTEQDPNTGSYSIKFQQ